MGSNVMISRVCYQTGTIRSPRIVETSYYLNYLDRGNMTRRLIVGLMIELNVLQKDIAESSTSFSFSPDSMSHHCTLLKCCSLGGVEATHCGSSLAIMQS